jgi:hypothetical protein
MQVGNRLNKERQRLEQQRAGKENWRLWGPYLSERAWGTVREDYSPFGSAWEDFDHEQARSRVFRWSEDGLGGICDEQQRLCFALALWNGKDPILKERAFGLTGNQGNHGEDVKEYYFYLDATPSHSYLRYLYKYCQVEYPYSWLVAENACRGRAEPPFNLLDAGVFNENRYWDVEVRYAKAGPEKIHIRLIAANRGPETETLHLLPTLWFRNTWSWGPQVDEWGNPKGVPKPKLTSAQVPRGAQWAVRAQDESLGEYFLYGQHKAEPLFTENESNAERLWDVASTTPFVKDAFHRYLINSEKSAINPELTGTKFAALHMLTVAPGHTMSIDMTLSKDALAQPFAERESVLSRRASEASMFYDELLSDCTTEDANILRQSLAGMIWSKQFFNYDVAKWLDGDQLPPPDSRKWGRNHNWRHMKARHVISMPDKWEYPWFAAWDLAFHCAALALVDVDFAKDQVELLLKGNYSA